MVSFSKVAFGLSLALVGVAASARQAEAQWSHEFYKITVAASASHQSGGACCSNKQVGWVNPTLTSGRPTLSAAGAAYAGNNAIAGAANSILPWWTVAAGVVEADGSGFNLFGNTSFNTGAGFYPTGAGGNSVYQRAAYIHGVAVNAGTSNWKLLGDDDAWLFINGNLVLDNGGVKAFNNGQATYGDVIWAVGDNIEIFFSDRMTVQSQLELSAAGLQVGRRGEPSQVPEPGSLALLATGLVAVGAVARRRRTA